MNSGYSYLREPIVAGERLGGVSLGESRGRVLEKLGKPFDRSEPDDKTEVLRYPGMSILLEEQQVRYLRGEFGYQGMTAEGIYVGMKWSVLRGILPTIEFEPERLDAWRVPSREGIAFKLAEWDLNVSASRRHSLEFQDVVYRVQRPFDVRVAAISIEEWGTDAQ